MVSLWEALAGSTVLEMKKIESLIIFSPVILHSEKCLNVVLPSKATAEAERFYSYNRLTLPRQARPGPGVSLS
jgi:hypothetical protein